MGPEIFYHGADESVASTLRLGVTWKSLVGRKKNGSFQLILFYRAERALYLAAHSQQSQNKNFKRKIPVSKETLNWVSITMGDFSLVSFQKAVTPFLGTEELQWNLLSLQVPPDSPGNLLYSHAELYCRLHFMWAASPDLQELQFHSLCSSTHLCSSFWMVSSGYPWSWNLCICGKISTHLASRLGNPSCNQQTEQEISSVGGSAQLLKTSFPKYRDLQNSISLCTQLLSATVILSLQEGLGTRVPV